MGSGASGQFWFSDGRVSSCFTTARFHRVWQPGAASFVQWSRKSGKYSWLLVQGNRYSEVKTFKQKQKQRSDTFLCCLYVGSWPSTFTGPQPLSLPQFINCKIILVRIRLLKYLPCAEHCSEHFKISKPFQVWRCLRLTIATWSR